MPSNPGEDTVQLECLGKKRLKSDKTTIDFVCTPVEVRFIELKPRMGHFEKCA